ncbi:MAG TPA: RsmB/NOP family class I SAM-dependent RNA methyltransferase [Azospirillaceae bacterium]|nr:RsmB/NOP family class I SAM-dependent RNA methyltransferase [Azospirillaceae bacterium]
MTPAARLQAIIELYAEVMATPRPADTVVSAWFRARRYIGSKDRAAVAEALYNLLRRHARLGWWLERLGAADTPRTRVLADQILARGRRADTLIGLFSGGRFGPAELDDAERRLARALETHTLEHPEMPDAVRLECPAWAESSLRAALGDRFVPEMAHLLEPAPLDLRVNAVKATREEVLAGLEEAGIKARPTRLSPWGIRVEGRPPIAQTELFRNGLIEIQDEGSQLLALLLGARPGHQVVDFCAGAGGKSLAIAAMMANKGRVIASDVLANRLKRGAERFRRAGLHNIETRPLSSERDPWVKRHKAMFDRVLVDAPCTGTGTWRRNPDSRWRLLGPALPELTALQGRILESAARLVKPGGRLVYATCSLLPDENEAQVDAFLAGHPDFVRVPAAEAWAQSMAALGGTPFPGGGPDMRLTPARDETDGFYGAVLERRAPAAEGPDPVADPSPPSDA